VAWLAQAGGKPPEIRVESPEKTGANLKSEVKMLIEKTQQRKIRVVRRTSEYNKYIKWFAEIFDMEDRLIGSSGYRTRQEAINSLTPTPGGLPRGKYLIKTENIWID